jgi:hypothetical protein
VADGSMGNAPFILIEGVLVFGGALAFGWWQLRSIKRDQQALAERRRAEAQAEAEAARRSAVARPPAGTDDAAPPAA